MTTRYSPKLRLLVTDTCSHSCPFCHNEGQARSSTHLDVDRLSPHLGALRRRFRDVTLSGGEPLQSPSLVPLVERLNDFSFDITVDTAGAELEMLSGHLPFLIKSLHCSVMSLDASRPLGNCNGNADVKVVNLRAIRASNPQLLITLNVPFVDSDHQLLELVEMVDLATSLDADLKYIGELQLKGRHPQGTDSWSDRWSQLAANLDQLGFSSSTSNPREVEYIGPSGRTIGLADIACASVDPSYADGSCFYSMDLTIEPDLSVNLCRWTPGSMPIEDVIADPTEELARLTKQDLSDCPHGIQTDPRSVLLAMPKIFFRNHGEWPDPESPMAGQIASAVAESLARHEISHFGRDGSVRRFEADLAQAFEIEHVATVSSGGAALRAAFGAIGLGPGDDVIVPSISYPGAIAPLLELGATVVFCDVSARTGLPSAEALAACVTAATRAIVVTHLWGRPVDVLRLRALIPADVRIVEDASHAVGGRVTEGWLGTLGDIGCFSLQANKTVFAGEGGFILTRSRELFDRVVSATSLRARLLDDVADPQLRSTWQSGLGTKQKLHPLGASIARVSLRHLKTTMEQRETAISMLSDAVRSVPTCPVEICMPFENEVVPAFYKPRLRVLDGSRDTRDRVLSEMLRRGAQVGVAESDPLPTTAVFRRFQGASDDGTPENSRSAQAFCDSTIVLPNLNATRLREVEWYSRVLEQI